jgi:hypothetical protein
MLTVLEFTFFVRRKRLIDGCRNCSPQLCACIQRKDLQRRAFNSHNIGQALLVLARLLRDADVLPRRLREA